MRRRRAAAAGLLIGALGVLVAGCRDEAGSSTDGGPAASGAGGGAGAGGSQGGGGGAAPYAGPPIPWEHQPFPEVAAEDQGTPEQIALGRALFYDPILSGDQATACVTCHSQLWGLGDGLPLSVGIGGDGPIGPGRTGPNVTSRNAPTLWNVAFRSELFWDGRAASLEEQAMAPLRNELELDLDPEAAAQALAAIPAYVELFTAAFPDADPPVQPDTIARALAALERTFISRRAPYDQYLDGDEGAIDPEARRGMVLFAEAGCHACHTPPLFASDTYADRGLGDGSDPGRQAETGDAADRGAFRVPTVRNLRDTEPYFHDGSVVALEDAVSHEVARQVEDGLSRPLAADEIGAISRFVNKALQDTSESPHRPREVPSGLPIPEDGRRSPR